MTQQLKIKGKKCNYECNKDIPCARGSLEIVRNTGCITPVKLIFCARGRGSEPSGLISIEKYGIAFPG